MTDLNKNEIKPTPEIEALDDIPTANASGQEGKNSKKLKVILFIFTGVVIMLIGIGVASGRFQAASSAAKAEEAEKAAQEQKQLADGQTVDIARDQANIENSNFQPLPCPVSDPNCQPENIEITEEPEVTPVVAQQYEQTQPVQTVQPTYNTYSQSTEYQANVPTEAPVQSIPLQSYEAPISSQEEDDVLVDIYAKTITTATPTQQRETGLAKSFESSKLLSGTASKRGDSTMLLAKGTSIPCVLTTKIDSTYKGFTTCRISKDVYSANGRVLLLERGSTVFGEQNVDIKQGQARVAVLWSRIETPKGVSVDIDSPATGKLGEMGLEAKVKNHWAKRFGGAIMLSMIQDVSANASTRLAKDGQQNENTANNSTKAAESMAEKALENTINIPPTATVNHGSLINILVVRDVDFGGIYELRKF